MMNMQYVWNIHFYNDLSMIAIGKYVRKTIK